jgi:hypothetical protein
VDTLSHIEIDSLKTQEEEALKLSTGSENCSISNIICTIQMHTVLIFKQQEKFKEPEFKKEG